MEDIDHLIDEIKEEIIKLRREFHQIPEVSMKEYKTSDKIAAYLESCGIKVAKEIGKTGVVGLLEGKKQGKTLAIRSDMDALPIEEKTNLDFSSKHEGTMHACGHDGHISILLGTAKVLSNLKDQIQGNIKFIFQPAEEDLIGAKAMIEDNVMEDPEVDEILGLHIWPDIDSGSIGVQSGPVMAAVDRFDIKIIGKGGHGGIPNKAIDPVVMTANLIERIQSIVSREIAPTKAAVITIGELQGGTAYNIIPDNVKVSGTVRTFDSEVRKYIEKRMRHVVKNVIESFGGKYEFSYENKVPPVVNNEALTQKITNRLESMLGKEKVIRDFELSMGGEDFALFQNRVPGTYMFLGTKNEAKGINNPIHHPEYNIDEDILPLGIKVFSDLALDLLKH